MCVLATYFLKYLSGCNFFIHTNKKGQIIKLNDKPFNKTTDVKSLHSHTDATIDVDLNKLKHWENLKQKPTEKSGSVMSMFEDEQIRLANEGYDDDYIAHNTYQYTEKSSSAYRR